MQKMIEEDKSNISHLVSILILLMLHLTSFLIYFPFSYLGITLDIDTDTIRLLLYTMTGPTYTQSMKHHLHNVTRLPHISSNTHFTHLSLPSCSLMYLAIHNMCVTLGPGRYKCRLKLAQGQGVKGKLLRVMAIRCTRTHQVVLLWGARTSTCKSTGDKYLGGTGDKGKSREDQSVDLSKAQPGQWVKVVQVRTKLELHVCATGVYIGQLSVHRPW